MGPTQAALLKARFLSEFFRAKVRCEKYPPPLQSDPFDLVLGKTLLRPVIELGRARALVRRQFLRVLERAAIGKVSGDAGRAANLLNRGPRP